MSTFVTEWNDLGSNANHVVNVQAKLTPKEGSGTLSADDSAKALKKITFKLYKGDVAGNLLEEIPIATKSFYNNDTFNIKEAFYDDGFAITSDQVFGLDIDDLKELNDGKQSSTNR